MAWAVPTRRTNNRLPIGALPCRTDNRLPIGTLSYRHDRPESHLTLRLSNSTQNNEKT